MADLKKDVYHYSWGLFSPGHEDKFWRPDLGLQEKNLED